MSSVKVARALRNEDSVQLRKQILKNSLSSVSRGDDAIFNTLAESNDKYLERIQSLSKFTKKSKSTTKLMSHKSVWLQEQHNLSESALQLQKEVSDILSGIVLSNPSDNEVHELTDEMTSLYDNRVENFKILMSQWQDINSMKNDIVNGIKKSEKREGLASSDAESMSSQLSIAGSLIDLRKIPAAVAGASAVFAEILMKIHESLHIQSMDFQSVEASLFKEILRDRNTIFQMLHQDVLSDQNEILRNELQIKEDDDLSTDAFIQDWLAKFPVLDSELQLKLSEIQREKENVCYEHNVGIGDINGGWSSEVHDVFVKIYKRAQHEGMNRKKMIEILLAELPGKTKQDVMAHEEWYRMMKFLNNKRSETLSEYENKRSDMVKRLQEELKTFRAQRLEAKANDEDLKNREAHRDLVHKVLEKMRMEKAMKLEEELAEKQRIKQIEDERLADLQEQAKEEQIHRKEKVAEYKKQKDDALQAKLKQEQELEMQKLEILRQEIEKNRAFVEERQRKFQEKQEIKKKKEVEEELAELRRLEWLAKLAEQVPYFDAIQNAHHKLDHITAAVEGQKYIKIDYTRGHLPMNGFADGRIIKDARFRLATALRELGVIHSEAAKQAIANFHPRPHLAIHGIL